MNIYIYIHGSQEIERAICCSPQAASKSQVQSWKLHHIYTCVYTYTVYTCVYIYVCAQSRPNMMLVHCKENGTHYKSIGVCVVLMLDRRNSNAAVVH